MFFLLTFQNPDFDYLSQWLLKSVITVPYFPATKGDVPPTSRQNRTLQMAVMVRKHIFGDPWNVLYASGGWWGLFTLFWTKITSLQGWKGPPEVSIWGPKVRYKAGIGNFEVQPLQGAKLKPDAPKMQKPIKNRRFLKSPKICCFCVRSAWRFCSNETSMLSGRKNDWFSEISESVCF